MSKNKNNKFILVYILTAIFFVAIVYQWFKFAPYRATPPNKDHTWQQISQRASQALGAISDNFSVVRDNIVELREETAQAAKQKILVEQVRKYIANLQNSTTTAASTTTADNPVSNN